MPPLGPKARRILAYLATHPGSYGSALARKLSRGKVLDGGIYVLLHRLEARGLVASALEARPKGLYPGQKFVPRRLYVMTAKGWAIGANGGLTRHAK